MLSVLVMCRQIMEQVSVAVVLSVMKKEHPVFAE